MPLETILLFVSAIVFATLLCSYWLKRRRDAMTSGPESEASSEPSAQQYQTYETDPTQVLAEKNAGNIEYIKERLGDVDDINGRMADIEQQVNSLQSQIGALTDQQAQYAAELAGDEPITITGATYPVEEAEEEPVDVNDE